MNFKQALNTSWKNFATCSFLFFICANKWIPPVSELHKKNRLLKNMNRIKNSLILKLKAVDGCKIEKAVYFA